MQLITPRQFCRIYFRLDTLPEADIREIEKSHGYKTRCAEALAKVLGMSKTTLINIRFSKGIEFEGLSNQSRLVLTMWVIEKRYPQAIHRLDEFVGDIISRPTRRIAA